jgi:hypothetical protein
VQDHARSFAGSATDEDKYKLYMAATGFDAVLRGLAASEAQVVQWRDRLKAVQEQLTVSGLPTHTDMVYSCARDLNLMNVTHDVILSFKCESYQEFPIQRGPHYVHDFAAVRLDCCELELSTLELPSYLLGHRGC